MVCTWQENFRKLVEIEKKLVGDVGGSLITPTRVSRVVGLEWAGGNPVHHHLVSSCLLETTQGRRSDQVLPQGAHS